MTKEEFVTIVNDNLKLVRTEFGLTQDKMAVILGISKKTLVESEKGRRAIGWTEAVALITMFADSTVLQNAFGGDAVEIVKILAFDNVEVKYPSTMGGKIWWRDIKKKGGYKIQQNIISNHYRILDSNNSRITSSLHLNKSEEYLDNIK